MLLIEIGAELSAEHVGTVFSVPYQRAGMEGFDAVGAFYTPSVVHLRLPESGHPISPS